MSVERTVTPTPGKFPDKTAVGCYLKTAAEVERREGRVPAPAPAATGVISSGAVTFTGLEPKTDYVMTGFVDEIQVVTVKAKKGKFKLTFEGQQTAGIKYNATATELKEALVALSNVAEGDVEVSGGPGSESGSAPYKVKFLKAWAGKNVAAMTSSVTELEESPKEVLVTTETQGSKASSGGTQIDELFTTGE